MRYEFQINEGNRPIFVKSVAIEPRYVELVSYETQIGRKCTALQHPVANRIIYNFDGVADRISLYLISTTFAGRPVMIASALGYKPEIRDEMLREFIGHTDSKETNDVPEDFMEFYRTTFESGLQDYMRVV